MVKKYGFPFLAAVLLFFLAQVFLAQLSSKPSEMAVVIKAEVLEDDTFQLFYLRKGIKGFNEKESVVTQVKGDTTFQTIRFAIPLDTTIKRLRIDIGKNKNQRPIQITSVSIENEYESHNYDISKDFTKNICITQQNGKFVTKMVSNSYDPFFISNFDTALVIKNLVKEIPQIGKKIALLISLLFAIAFFISLSLMGIEINRFSPSAYILFFVLIIATPQIVKLFETKEEDTSNEKRKLAEKPEFAFTESFPKEYEAYFNDNFGLRSIIINWSSKLKISLFKDSPKPELAQFGKDGFLFFNEYNEEDGGIYSSYSNTNLATKNQLQNAYQNHLEVKNALSKRGISYVFGFWPNKHSVYKELLPLTMKLQVKQETSLADQTVAYFEKRKLPVFDVRNEFLESKNENQLYFKFDTHWNANGAYQAYKSFCHQTFDELGLSPFSIEDFDITHKKVNKGDLTNLMGIDSITTYYDEQPIYKLKNKDKNYRFISPEQGYTKAFVTENKNCGNEKTALVFRDSYGVGLMQFLSLHYAKVIYVVRSNADMYWINKINPDVVILGVVERRLPYMLDMVE